MEFPGVLKKQHVEISGSIKEEVEFLGVFEKNSCEISMGLVFFILEFPRDVTKFCRTSWGESLFSLEFLMVK